MSQPLPDRLFSRVPQRYRGQVPPEIPALWREPARLRVLVASVVSMFALAIFPPYFSPGAEAIQETLKDDPASLGLVVLLGIGLGAGVILFGGAVGDTTGHRRWLLLGLLGVLASCALGLALGEDGLLPAALLGAFWSGFAMPLGVAIVADAYPERAVQDMAIGLGIGAWAAAQVIGPFIQDTLADVVGLWAIWLLPVGSAVIAIYLVWRRVPEHEPPDDVRRRDIVAQALLAAIPLTAASFFIVLLPGETSVMAITGLAILGAVGVIALVIRRGRGRSLLPGGAAPARMILVAMFVGVFMSFAVNAPLTYFGSFLRVIRDWGEIVAAAALAPHLIALLLGGLWAPLLAYRFGYARVILVSMVVLCVSTALFALASVDSTYLWFVAPLITLGLGMIIGATARSGLIMSRMPAKLPALANALNLAAMELGGILGSTVTTVLMMRSATERYEELLVGEGVEAKVVASMAEAFRDILRTVTPGGTTMIEPAQVEGLLPGFREAMADGLSWSLWLVTGVTVAATVVAWAGFRWARRRDALPAVPIQRDPEAEGTRR